MACAINAASFQVMGGWDPLKKEKPQEILLLQTRAALAWLWGPRASTGMPDFQQCFVKAQASRDLTEMSYKPSVHQREVGSGAGTSVSLSPYPEPLEMSGSLGDFPPALSPVGFVANLCQAV